MKHTKEPWSPDGENWITGNGGGKIFSCDSMSRADRNRIIACVNACANINPAAIQGVVKALKALLPDWTKEEFAHNATQPRGSVACEISCGDVADFYEALAALEVEG